jgi:hypothetical protein
LSGASGDDEWKVAEQLARGGRDAYSLADCRGDVGLFLLEIFFPA